MAQAKFTLPEIWYGGFYELSIEIGERSDENLLAVLQAVWKQPRLTGCYLRGDIEPQAQKVVAPNIEHIASGYHLRGLATLPNGTQIACGSVAVRESGGIDWFGLYIPMGALGTAYDVGGYPFDEENHEVWRKSLENWFAEIGMAVYQVAKFRLGLIGHEVSGVRYASEIATRGIPDERPIGYLWPEAGEIKYYPTTIRS